MTRSQSAYLRAVKAALAKMGKADRFDANRAMTMYDDWIKAPVAAEVAVHGECIPVEVMQEVRAAITKATSV